jgi:predicted transcriptional regulator
VIVRAVANAGIRGKLHTVYLRNQTPKLSFDQVMELFSLSADNNIRLMSDMIPTRVDTIAEIIRGRDMDEETIHRMETIIEKVSKKADSASVNAILHNSTFVRTIYI